MVANDTASFLLEWIKEITLVFTAVIAVTWPAHMFLKNKTDKEHEAEDKKADRAHELKKLEYDRQVKRDREIIEQIVNDAFNRNMQEMKQSYTENYHEIQNLIRQGQLK